MAIVLNDGVYTKAPKPQDLKTTVGPSELFTNRSNIPASYRWYGMEVFDKNDGLKYRLQSDKTTWIIVDSMPAWIKPTQNLVQLSSFGGNLDASRIDNLPAPGGFVEPVFSANSLPYGQPANVSGVYPNLVIGVPQGQPGTDGVPGANGANGSAATISVGAVTTIPYTDPANVINTGNSSAAVFEFRIPKGSPGLDGSNAMGKYVYEQAEYLAQPYVDAQYTETSIPELDVVAPEVPSGFHGTVYIKDIETWFCFSRDENPKVFIFEDIKNLDVYSTIAVGESGRTGVESVSYSKTTRKIYFTITDYTYTIRNVIVKSIHVDTKVITPEINYDTGIDAGATLVLAVDNYLYVVEGNYNFKINRFTLAGTFVSSVASGIASKIAHNINTDGRFVYVGTHTTYDDKQYIGKISINTFSTFISEELTLANSIVSAGEGGFTDKTVIIGDYWYLGTEGYNGNLLLKVNIKDLSDYEWIDIPMPNLTDSYWDMEYFNGNLFLAGTGKFLAGIDIYTGIITIYHSPFSYNINGFNVTEELLLCTGFDVQPVDGTGFVGTARFFDVDHRVMQNVVLKPIKIQYGEWLVYGASGNTNNELQPGDLVSGWWSATEFWRLARYDGGDVSVKANWTIMDKITF